MRGKHYLPCSALFGFESAGECMEDSKWLHKFSQGIVNIKDLGWIALTQWYICWWNFANKTRRILVARATRIDHLCVRRDSYASAHQWWSSFDAKIFCFATEGYGSNCCACCLADRWSDATWDERLLYHAWVWKLPIKRLQGLYNPKQGTALFHLESHRVLKGRWVPLNLAAWMLLQVWRRDRTCYSYICHTSTGATHAHLVHRSQRYLRALRADQEKHEHHTNWTPQQDDERHRHWQMSRMLSPPDAVASGCI